MAAHPPDGGGAGRGSDGPEECVEPCGGVGEAGRGQGDAPGHCEFFDAEHAVIAADRAEPGREGEERLVDEVDVVDADADPALVAPAGEVGQ